MAKNNPTQRIIGYWRGAIRAVFICPHCSRTMMAMKIETLKELLGRPARRTGPKLRCLLCAGPAFIHLKQPWERVWQIMKDGQKLMRFDGWTKQEFLMRADALYSKDNKALLNIRRLREMGFRRPGRSRDVKKQWVG